MRLEELPPFLTTKECAEVVRLSPHTLNVRRSTGTGDRPEHIKTGHTRSSRVLYKRAAVLDFLQERGMLTPAERAELG
jgi:hypothetical protein